MISEIYYIIIYISNLGSFKNIIVHITIKEMEQWRLCFTFHCSLDLLQFAVQIAHLHRLRELHYQSVFRMQMKSSMHIYNTRPIATEYPNQKNEKSLCCIFLKN